MIAETLSVGTELLLGQIVDTNSAHLARTLSNLGIDLYHHGAVGDNPTRLCEALASAFARADTVITIGGLGPTMDDITKEAVCDVLGVEMFSDPVEERKLRALASRRGYSFPPSFLKQATLPRPPHGRGIPNPVGTAPGIWVEKDGKIAISLPGPPNEFLPMLEQSVGPWLAEHLGEQRLVIRSLTLRIIGIGESVAEEAVKDLMLGDNPTVAPYAKLGECQLRITARAKGSAEADALIAPVEAEIRRRLGRAVYGVDDETLEFVVVKLLTDLGQTVTTAESCTGGMLAQQLTSVPGSSEIFREGYVTYADTAKSNLLGVSAESLLKYGAVSEQVASEMAAGALTKANANFAVAVTGIAGPTGASEDKPVGLVYIAVARGLEISAQRHLFGGSRDDVRRRSAHAALAALRNAILKT